MPERSDWFTIRVIDDNNSSTRAFNSSVGMGSNEHVEVGDCIMILRIDSSDILENVLKCEDVFESVAEIPDS